MGELRQGTQIGRDTRQLWRTQDRYLVARSRRDEPLELPNGLRVIRKFPEWRSGWPLWENSSADYRLTGPDLGLSSDLRAAMLAWIEQWQERQDDDPLPDGWLEAGHPLFERLTRELDGIAEVRPEYLP